MTFKTLYEIFKHSVENFSERIAFSMIDGEDVIVELGSRKIVAKTVLGEEVGILFLHAE